MDKNSSETNRGNKEPVSGIVTARKCDCCGHHEIGVTTQAGQYIPLKVGMVVNIIGVTGD